MALGAIASCANPGQAPADHSAEWKTLEKPLNFYLANEWPRP